MASREAAMAAWAWSGDAMSFYMPKVTLFVILCIYDTHLMSPYFLKTTFNVTFLCSNLNLTAIHYVKPPTNSYLEGSRGSRADDVTVGLP